MDMYEKRIRLRELMAKPECVPVMGAYDVLSAKLIEATGFPIVYTGSFITGASQYFLADVGLVQLKDLLPLAYEIAKEVDLPLICDVDNGWFHSGNIWRTVHEFESAGVSGITGASSATGISACSGSFSPSPASISSGVPIVGSGISGISSAPPELSSIPFKMELMSSGTPDFSVGISNWLFCSSSNSRSNSAK